MSHFIFQHICIHLVHRFQNQCLWFWSRSGAPRQFLQISRRLGRPEPARLGKSEKSQSRAGPAEDFGRFSKNFGDFGRISGRPAVQILEFPLIFFRFSLISIEKPTGIQAIRQLNVARTDPGRRPRRCHLEIIIRMRKPNLFEKFLK